MLAIRERSNVSRLALLTGLGLVAMAPATARAQSLPQGGTVAQGQARIHTGERSVSITQRSSRAVVNWQSFSVGAGNSVKFDQPGGRSAILNRVTGDAGSTIAGKITANGKVYLVNPNGIQITGSGVVQARRFVASTLGIGDSDFMSGRDRFVGGGASAAVGNDGVIETEKGAFLIGGSVVSKGSIGGSRVGLAAGERVSIDAEGDGFLTVSAPSEDLGRAAALIDTSGTIRGGRIEVKAATSADLARAAINLGGTVEAKRVVGRADGAVRFGGRVEVDGGPGGSVAVQGRIAATGRKGGSIAVTGREVALRAAAIDVSGERGGGRIRIGGEARGQGDLRNSDTVSVDAGSALSADAGREGDGGSVVVWADGTTGFAGRISARGGTSSGNGGDAEVSGKAHLHLTGDYATSPLADLSATDGAIGTLLFDPGTVLILPQGALAEGAQLNGPDTFTAEFVSGQLATASVTIDTNDGTGANGTAGDIILKEGASISWSAATTLTLNAANDIVLEAGASITNGSGAGTLVLRADVETAPDTTAGTGTVRFAGGTQVDMGGGSVRILYNPASNPAGSGVNAASYAGAPTADETWASFVSAGTIDARMLVNTVQDLQNVQNNLAGSYAVGRDIDASGTAGWNGGAGFEPIGTEAGRFTGKLDGQYHTISSLSIDRPALSDAGLFGFLGNKAEVRNLHLGDFDITGYLGVGLLAGVMADEALVSKVSATGSVTGRTAVGGLVGTNGPGGTLGTAGTIEDSRASADVAGHHYVGGLVGRNLGTISGSQAAGHVSATLGDAGGLVGYNDGTISGSAASALVDDTPFAEGGFVGSNSGDVLNSRWDDVASGLPSVGVQLRNGTSDIVPAAGPYPDLSWESIRPYAPPQLSGTRVTIVATGLDRVYGDGNSLGFIVLDENGAVIPVSEYGNYFSGAGPALDSTGLVRLAAGETATVYVAKGDLIASAGYRLVFENGTFDIGKRSVSANVVANDKVYDGTTDATLGVASLAGQSGSTGLLAGDDVVLGGSATGAFADKNAGTGKAVTITGTFALSGADAGNYALVTPGSTTASITARTLTAAADDLSKLEGGADDPLLTYQVTVGSLVAGDLFSGALARDAGEAAGSYGIGAGTLTAGSNYSLTVVPGTFTILPVANPGQPNPGQPQPNLASAGNPVLDEFIRPPTQIENREIAGPDVSGPGVAGLFGFGVADIVTASTEVAAESGISHIVTSSIGTEEASAEAQDGRCFVEEPGMTLKCPAFEQQ